MKKFFLPALGICFIVTVTLFSCNKINLPTELGQELIPPVDNIHTFDTTLDVETYNGLFDPALDSFRTGVNFPQLLGVINNDPIFGKTDARMFFQVSPGAYPFKNRPGSLYLDSVVLVINHHENGFIYGDTLLPQTIQVSEIEASNDFRYDSLYKINTLFTTSGILGTKTFIPASLKDSIQVINYPDTVSVVNQLRIKLDNSFGQRLLSYDSTGANDGYSTDSVFRTRFKGFALQSVSGGNALISMYLNNATTQMVVYYRYNNVSTPSDIDTASAAFTFYNGENAIANYISRDYNGTQVLTGSGDLVQDPVVYIQNTPGTYANIKIPGLKSFPNGIIHLAELRMESIYDVSDTVFYAPPNVFLDVYDSTAEKFKLVPYAFGYGGTTLSGYEGFYSARSSAQTYYSTLDPLGNKVLQWRFNVTRYAQHLVSGKIPYYMMRVYAPAGTGLPLGDLTPFVTSNFAIPQSNFYGIGGIGRARIGGGSHPNQKMKLRIVYSKL